MKKSDDRKRASRRIERGSQRTRGGPTWVYGTMRAEVKERRGERRTEQGKWRTTELQERRKGGKGGTENENTRRRTRMRGGGRLDVHATIETRNETMSILYMKLYMNIALYYRPYRYYLVEKYNYADEVLDSKIDVFILYSVHPSSPIVECNARPPILHTIQNSGHLPFFYHHLSVCGRAGSMCIAHFQLSSPPKGRTRCRRRCKTRFVDLRISFWRVGALLS